MYHVTYCALFVQCTLRQNLYFVKANSDFNNLARRVREIRKKLLGSVYMHVYVVYVHVCTCTHACTHMEKFKQKVDRLYSPRK